MEERDAVIVGARCAGATLAIELARRDWDVLVVDRDMFPSDTVSTHFFYPNTLSRFAQLGILDTLRSSHRLPSLAWRVIGMGHEIAGKFTPVDGFDRASSARRITLDKGILDTALAAGAEGRFGEKVVALIGSGTNDDPVSGAVLESGERISANWGVRRRRKGIDRGGAARDREGTPPAGRALIPVRLLARTTRRWLRDSPHRGEGADQPL